MLLRSLVDEAVMMKGLMVDINVVNLFFHARIGYVNTKGKANSQILSTQ